MTTEGCPTTSSRHPLPKRRFGTYSWIVDMDTDTLEVMCADIGSIPRERFAWARRLPAQASEAEHDPTSIEAMASAIVACLQAGTPVAVGFEAPLFLPVPETPNALGKARPTDAGAPSWSSQTGACVMATGIVQAAWVLRRIFEQYPRRRYHSTGRASRRGVPDC